MKPLVRNIRRAAVLSTAMLLCSLCCASIRAIPIHSATSIPDSQQEEYPENEDILIMFWNLENFFDTIDGGAGESDREFSAHGTRHWGRKKFQAKCAAIAKTMMWVGDRQGRMPDIFAVAEVENRNVLRQLIEGTIIRKYGYSIVHYDSPDPRGIDVALLYRDQALELLESRPVRVHGTSPAPAVSSPAPSVSQPAASVPERPSIEVQSQLVTRDILMTKFRVAGDTIAVLVNHHPSKYGGGDTDWRRDLALARLKALKDSLVLCGVTKVVATGDFNDTPENTRFQMDTLAPFTNLAVPLSARGEGTIRFNGRWDLIDMFMVTPALLPPADRMEILHPPFLTAWDNVHPGEKPLRTYSGPRYLGGVSDHRPVILRLHQGVLSQSAP